MDRKNHELPPHHETAGPSNSGANADVKPIFLSHSGHQKTFVEQLFDALTNANQSAFFDKHTLDKASSFPLRIKQAALGCKLGVVVISDDFFMSKWPMIELELLVNQRGSDPMVLPLFYKLQPKDLKSPTNLDKWRAAWKENAGKHVAEWEEAVHKLRSINGVEFIERSSETAYIQKVVGCICNLVPCHVLYDVSWVQGYQRLVEEIAGLFEEIKAECSEKLACVVGLHGIGGLGKTTLCKCMINFYTTQYCGRSCLIEFPSNGDKVKIVQECQGALKKLTNLSMERLSNEAGNFDQVVHLLREHVKKYDVFLAIDNVWEDCREEAERLLGVGFSAKSRVLVTSRSERVLQDLLLEHTKTSCIVPLPAPEHEEAFQIFQKTFKLCDLRCLVGTSEMDRALERCRFNGTYHSLALKALAQYVQRVCVLEGLENIKHRLPIILKEVSHADLQTVEKVIRLSYDIMLEYKKHMFLDIVVLAIRQDRVSLFNEITTYARAHRWLCVLYKEFRETNITELMYELASDGLIQIGGDNDAEKTLEVHDLYVDLAQREAASSPRFLTNKLTRSVREMEWERLERVLCLGDEDACFLMKLQQEACPKLQVLLADGIKMRGGVRLGLIMPSLCVLRLELIFEVTSRKWKRWFAASARVLKLNGLVQLQTLHLERCYFVKRIGGLYALQNLQTLHIEGCPRLKSLDGLSGLIQLEDLYVGNCKRMKKIENLRGLTGLEKLQLEDNGAMEEVGCLSPALKVVNVINCQALRKMADLSGLPQLERLELVRNCALKEVGGESLSSSLKHFKLDAGRGGGGLRRFPSLNPCVHLQTLRIDNALAIVDGLLLEKLANLHDLQLNVSKWRSNCLNEQQWKHLSLLQSLTLKGFRSIEKLEVGGLSSLKCLYVRNCEALEEIGDGRALHGLLVLHISQCPRLKKVSGLVGILTHGLQELWMWGCGSFEVGAIPGVSLVKSVESGEISDCGNLQHLQVSGGGNWSSNRFNEPQWEHLQHLSLADFGSIEKLELGCFGRLESLSVGNCEALEEIGDVSALHCLSELHIVMCPRLKKVSGLVGILTHLLVLRMRDCGSLEASTIPDVSLLNSVRFSAVITRCGNLEDWKKPYSN